MFAAIRKNSDLQLLLGIVLLGLGLRLWGIQHGFPFIFHPDEPAVVRSATGIRFEANPGHFDWPHLHFYLNYLVYFVFIKLRGLVQALGLRSALAGQFPLLWQDPLVFYWISRVLDAFMGAFTAVPVFLAGKALFNRRVGLLAALGLVLMPLHVQNSHLALVDIPAVFWASWGLYFATLIYKVGGWKNYALAGLFVGLAASTKYNAGLSALVVFTAFLLSGERLKNFKNLVISGIAAILGFLIGTPFALLDFKTFSRTDSAVGALWQFENVGSVDIATRIQQFVGVATTTFASDFGYVFLALFWVFVVYSVFKRERQNWLIIFPALFLFFYTAGFDKVRSHYFLITFPFVALSAGVVLDLILTRVAKNKKIVALVLLVMFALPAFLSFQRSLALARKDTRVLLYEWLEQNVKFDEFMVYNSSSLEQVVGKVSKDRSVKDLVSKNTAGKKGYIIVYTDGSGTLSEEESDFVSGFEKVHEINAEGRRGENILIYVFNQN